LVEALLVDDVVLDVDGVVVVELPVVAPLTVMAHPNKKKRAGVAASPDFELTKELEKILRHLVGRGFRRHCGLGFHFR